MTQHEKLNEQYEDALFAMLMYQASLARGKQVVQEMERLNKSDEDDTTAQTDKKLLSFCKRTIRSLNRRRKRGKAGKVLQRMAAAACLVLVLETSAFAFFPELMEKVWNLVVTVSEKDTQFSFEPVDSNNTSESYIDSEITDISIEWLPEDFYFQIEERMDLHLSYSFSDYENNEIHIEKAIDSPTFSIDTENANVENIQIQGFDAVLSEKDDTVIIAWANELRETVYCVTGIGVKKDDVIKIAKSIRDN